MVTTTRGLPSRWRRLGKLTLRVIDGPDQGTEVVLDGRCGQRLQGGRAPVNDIVLDDEHVSATHFELSLQASDGVRLRDCGSTNGVLMDNARIIDAVLGPGAVFRVGSSAIQLVSTTEVAVPLSTDVHFGDAFGVSSLMRELFAMLAKIAKADARMSVLITGETGTGKELVAQGLHAQSLRHKGPFVAVNCATIAPQLAESYLFGHRKGSFSGAHEDRLGCFEEANGGTLFLDEVGELPLDLQAKLLRALQQREISRIGEHRPRRVDVRVISATHRDLRWMVTENKFRDDLYFRLAQVPVSIPPLRERPEDIMPLVERFLAELAENGGPRRRIGDDAREVLLAHTWPGNVRELRNTLDVAYFMAEAAILTVSDLRIQAWGPVGGTLGLCAKVFDMELKDAREEFERLYLKRLLVSPGTLTSKAKRAGISDEGLRLARRRLGQ